MGEQQPRAAARFTRGERYGKALVAIAVHGDHLVLHECHGRIGEYLLACLGNHRARLEAVLTEKAVRVLGKAIARLPGIDDADRAPRPAELHRRREPGETAADHNHIEICSGLHW